MSHCNKSSGILGNGRRPLRSRRSDTSNLTKNDIATIFMNHLPVKTVFIYTFNFMLMTTFIKKLVVLEVKNND